MLSRSSRALVQAPAASSRGPLRHPVRRCPAAARLRRAGKTTRAAATEAPALPTNPITLTDKALEHLRKLRADNGQSDLLLRIGVKSGGCSGMSYVMDFEAPSNVQSADSVMEYTDGFRLVCDPKSLLYLFGMQLDYSSALIGGGFQFHNPSANSTCGCGKSFNV